MQTETNPAVGMSEYLRPWDGNYDVHPAAELFPIVDGEHFDRLVESVKQHGIQNPLVFKTVEGGRPLLLDGRNRLRAASCLKGQGVDVHVPVVVLDRVGDKIAEIEWITAQNLDRRHLTDDQRVMVALELHKMLAAESQDAQKATQFTSDTASAAASKKHDPAVTLDSASPQKRDRKKSEDRTTAGKIAEKAKVSKHKAKQAIAIDKAIVNGDVSPEVKKEILAGTKKVKDVVPAKPRPAATTVAPDVGEEMREKASAVWQRLKDKFAIDEHPRLRKVFITMLRDEEKQAG